MILLCVGILLVVIAIPTEKGKQTISENTDLEKRLETMLSKIEGCGEVHVMITVDEDDVVQGIAVAAHGGDNPSIVREITEVVKALFDIETHKIKVIKGGL